MRIGLIVVVALALSAGCAQKRSAPAARTGTPPPVAAPAASDPAGEAAAVDQEKRPRRGEAAVYIDGKSVGVLRRQELPPKLTSKIVKLGEGYEGIRYSLMDYVAALGADPKKLRAAHLYGGSRVVVIDRAELTRIGSEITFSFIQGDRGKPAVQFPPKKLNVNTTIDMLSSMSFYIDKEPPTLKDGELVMPDGSPTTGKVPYAPEEQGNGTRVYVDGALVATVKRKKLTNDVAVPDQGGAGPTKFSLVAYASKLGIDAKRAKAIDLVAGDDVVAHMAPDSAKDVTFYVPSHNRGQALVDVPSAGASHASQPARISAVQIFVKTTPPSRDVVSVDNASEASPNTSSGSAVGRGADDEP